MKTGMRYLTLAVAASVFAWLCGAAVPGAGHATAATTAPAFTDTFASAVDADPGYGLNDSLAARQPGTGHVTYTRVSGLWYPAAAPRPWYSQVNQVNRHGVLSFWLGTSAVRMDAPVVAGAGGAVSVQATVDPVVGDTSSGDWSSLVLSRDHSASGYVTGSAVALSVLVRSNGGVQVFQNGTTILSRNGFAKPDAHGRYNVAVSYAPRGRSAHLKVNGVQTSLTTPTALPASSTLFMGAYLTKSSEVSTLSGLRASAVDRTGLTLNHASGLRYYGYYAARLAGNSHLAEVAGRSNLNWINISDVNGYRSDVLNGCVGRSCVVYSGNEFFSCNTAGLNCHLYPDYRQRWARLAAAVRPKIGKVAAFYVQDEPQFRGATSAEIETSALLIKKTFPGTRVMMVEAGPAVTPSLRIPPAVDWVGFDWYCRPFSDVQQRLATLEALIPAGSVQRIFLLPEDAPLAECGGTTGHATDADIAALQLQYFQLAEQHPRVIGLMNFGFWTSQAWTGGHGASDLPATVDANERIAARIL